MTQPAVQVKGLVVRAGRRAILDLPAWQAAPGELVGLLGPNGAGKTTLLRCLLGLQGRARGSVAVLGRELGPLGAGALAALRRRIGYMPQLPAGRSETPLTVREVVAIGRTALAGLLRPLGREDWRTIDEWIERLGLSSLAGAAFGDLSGGEQRKALLARAMVARPELLLLDEPTANLDLGWRERFVGIIEELHRSLGLTVLLVCHELEVLPTECGRVSILAGGRLADDGRPEEVLSVERIAALYGPGLDVLRRGGRWAVVPAPPACRPGEASHA